ncbi:polymeric immunoglobulin receptor-like isoform X2 [Seriola aureovittata]|uniref:polymeric immunoglobulin receptor-like isoform X2 n=1 Tax=Seriola aureovittata TaxID=2871759 RepID=UPI0024BDE238|nr:polymeric immunoglobulin receptor-like isoform X2 [Seriola aureovittata]
MNIHHALLFCCLSALSDRNTGLINAQTIFTKTEGEDFKHNFTVMKAEKSRKYLCRNECKEGDVLIETHGRRAQSGRYIIRYDGVLNVAITELTQSDAGRYRFGISNSSTLGVFQDFKIKVRELCEGSVVIGEPRDYSSTEGGNVTIRCSLGAAERNRKFLCREDCKKVLIGTIDVVAKSGKYSIVYGSNRFFNVTIAQLTKSDSGRYRCGVGRQSSENRCLEFEIIVTGGHTLPLVVCLMVIVLLAVSLLLLYKWKRRSSTDLKCWRTLTHSNMEFVPYDDSARASTLEDPVYENLSSPMYETLHKQDADSDQMYSTLRQHI